MRIILLGAPGSGKGTQASIIEDKYGFSKISSGDLLRQEIEQKTNLGLKAQEAMDKGHLVSDELVGEIIKKRISSQDCKNGYVLDGFPRNISQAKYLEKMDRRRKETVLEIELEEKVLIQRLSSRRVCVECGAVFNLEGRPSKKKGICDACGGLLIQRRDDKPEVIRERLKVYQQQTKPLIEYYRDKKVYFPIDGKKTIPEVFVEISKILDKRLEEDRVTRQSP